MPTRAKSAGRTRTGLAAALLPGALALALGLAGCTGSTGLAPGLAARMDAPGARLDRRQALGLINQYRASRNVSDLAAAGDLEEMAQSLANRYAASGVVPREQLPGAGAVRFSAGYASFAETFSGWRNTPADADILAGPDFTEAGLGVAYSASSTFGVYWVLLLSGPAAQ